MTHAHRLLVVEDDLEIRETLVEILTEHGYEVRGVVDGHEALRSLRAGFRPCLILLDLMMPRMDGQAFRAEQMADPALADIPVVVLSAYRDVAENARAMNVTEHLRKPVRLSDLLTMARRYCASCGADPPGAPA